MYWKQANPWPLVWQSLSSIQAVKGALGDCFWACWFRLDRSSCRRPEARDNRDNRTRLQAVTRLRTWLEAIFGLKTTVKGRGGRP